LVSNRKLLQRVLLASEPLLRTAWARRRNERVVIVLADLGRPECRLYAEKFWGGDFVDRFAQDRAEMGHAAYLPYLRPRDLIDRLLGHANAAQRQAGAALRAVVARGAGVPVWVVSAVGHWATAWAPPAQPK
jgi:hypothetical protein